jgi:hypothetical protein
MTPSIVFDVGPLIINYIQDFALLLSVQHTIEASSTVFALKFFFDIKMLIKNSDGQKEISIRVTSSD